MVVGGFESMTNVPYLLPGGRFGMKYGHGKVIDGLISDGLWDVYNDVHMVCVAVWLCACVCVRVRACACVCVCACACACACVCCVRSAWLPFILASCCGLCVAVWLCGCVAVWLCGCVAVWLCGVYVCECVSVCDSRLF
ncbi:MAG: hypothetical protein P4L40_08325 [Terracidiphilus sp.]|nr:hypothetical protein [Terracidiphilus sp.]